MSTLDQKAQTIKEYKEQREIKAVEVLMYILYVGGLTAGVIGICLLPTGNIPMKALWIGIFLLQLATILGLSLLQSMLAKVLKNQKPSAE